MSGSSSRAAPAAWAATPSSSRPAWAAPSPRPAAPPSGTSSSASAPATFLASDSADGAGPATTTPEGGFDVVIDTVGGAVLEASYGMTRRGGRLVTLSAPPDADKAAALGLRAVFFVVTPDAAELAHLAALVDDGKLRPVLSQTFPLRDGREAFESATVPHPPGKTVLIVR